MKTRLVVLGAVLLTTIGLGQISSLPTESAPLAQATATPTPRTISIGGQPMPCTDSSSVLAGTCTQRVDTGGGGGSSFPYGAGTPVPVNLATPGVYTTVVRYVATVGATPGLTPVVPANANRIALVCQNDSDITNIYLGEGGTPTVGNGLRLNAGGGSVEKSLRQGNLWTGAVFAVATQTTSSIICIDGGP